MSVEALTRLLLIKRNNLGINPMFSMMLMEGKGPPVIREIGESVLVSFLEHKLNVGFRLLVADESRQGRHLGVDELPLLQYLLQYPEVDTATAAALCQRSEAEIRERLTSMEGMGYIEHGGTKRGAYWCINPALYKHLSNDDQAENRPRIDWEPAKTRVLSILIERARRDEPGLSHNEIQRITRFDRNQARRLMQKLMKENADIKQVGERR